MLTIAVVLLIVAAFGLGLLLGAVWAAQAIGEEVARQVVEAAQINCEPCGLRHHRDWRHCVARPENAALAAREARP